MPIEAVLANGDEFVSFTRSMDLTHWSGVDGVGLFIGVQALGRHGDDIQLAELKNSVVVKRFFFFFGSDDDDDGVMSVRAWQETAMLQWLQKKKKQEARQDRKKDLSRKIYALC